VNKTLNKLALDELGSPVIFNVIEQLSNSLAEFQRHFQNSQRKKEQEAAQSRENEQKKVSANAIKTITDAQYDGEKLGKRARQKLKAAQKARLQEKQEEESLPVGYKKKQEKDKQKELDQKNQEFRNFQSIRGSSHTQVSTRSKAEKINVRGG
jgi:hypothetical protein